jgi:hypothetical protein
MIRTDLTDGKFTMSDGKTEVIRGKGWQTMWLPAGEHLPENVSDTSLKVVPVERKTK